MTRIMWIAIAIFAVMLFGSAMSHAATITSSNGHHASVSSAFAPHAQCLVHRLESAGYKIDFMTGYAARGNASAHPTGNAIDINQTGFGRVTRRLPSGFVSIAASCGVYSGSHFGDTGHFEMPGKYGYVNLGGHHAIAYSGRANSAGDYASLSGASSERPDIH